MLSRSASLLHLRHSGCFEIASAAAGLYGTKGVGREMLQPFGAIKSASGSPLKSKHLFRHPATEVRHSKAAAAALAILPIKSHSLELVILPIF